MPLTRLAMTPKVWTSEMFVVITAVSRCVAIVKLPPSGHPLNVPTPTLAPRLALVVALARLAGHSLSPPTCLTVRLCARVLIIFPLPCRLLNEMFPQCYRSALPLTEIRVLPLVTSLFKELNDA